MSLSDSVPTFDQSIYVEYSLSYNNVEELQNNVEELQNNSAFVVVAADGTGKYNNILDAINTEPENTIIFIKPGIYNQDMTDCIKKRIILIGTDRNQCIIRDIDGRYGHHPLYVSCGYFENLTISSPYVEGESQ